MHGNVNWLHVAENVIRAILYDYDSADHADFLCCETRLAVAKYTECFLGALDYLRALVWWRSDGVIRVKDCRKNGISSVNAFPYTLPGCVEHIYFR